MVGVARRAEARDLGQHLRAATERVLQRLEHHRARALAGHESRAARVERKRRARRILRLRQRAEVREAREADGRHALLRAAGQGRVDVAVPDVAHGRADGVSAGGTGGDHVEALAAQPVADGQVAGGDVADHRGDEQRAHALRPLLGQREEAALQLVDAADARAEHACDARGVLGLKIEPRLRDGLVGRHDGVLHETFEATGLLFRDPVLSRIEVAHLGRDPHVVVGRVEARHRADAALLAHDGAPQRICAHAGGRHRAHAGDDHAMRAVGATRGGRRGHFVRVLAHSDIPPSMQTTCPVM